MLDNGLFPFKTNVELWLTGNTVDGGFLLIRENEKRLLVKMPQTLFLAALLLMQEALETPVDKDNPLPVHGFVPIDKLHKAIIAITNEQLFPERAYVIRYIYRLRLQFNRWEKKFGVSLLEYQDGIGYRFSTPSNQMHIKLLN